MITSNKNIERVEGLIYLIIIEFLIFMLLHVETLGRLKIHQLLYGGYHMWERK